MRTSGILMHISSLPGKFGIGTLGRGAYDFVDFLKASGQTYWQILPVCPPGYGDSPYQSFSTFAGNPHFVDFDLIGEDGFLHKSDYEDIDWGSTPERVDYALVAKNREVVFAKVYERFKESPPKGYKSFCAENSYWLDGFALYSAIKEAHGGLPVQKWQPDIRRREPVEVKKWTAICAEQIEICKMKQYFFFKQWRTLKKYAADRGIRIIGDIPIYVAADSADVWLNPQLFDLDEALTPCEVAGCPPDGFSVHGQLWGNPVYNWEYMKKDGYGWWCRRLSRCAEIYDVVRVDHFRGFESYYCIKYGDETAENGVWRKGPGADFFKAVEKKTGRLPIIAEDLGFMTEEVRAMTRTTGYPGMKVLQFAFDSREDSDYLPHNYEKNCVAYIGTHDNDTVMGWFDNADRRDVEFAVEYMRLDKSEGYNWGVIKSLLASPADTAIITMQDLLGLGSGSRMNTPSTVGGNWVWRARYRDLDPLIAGKLNFYTSLYKRKNYMEAVNE